MPYGTALKRSLPSDDEVRAILDCARALGVRRLDTAAAYGQSECRIGAYLASRPPGAQPFRISTKTLPSHAADLATARRWLGEALERSLSQLAPGRVDQLLLHRWDQRVAFGGALWRDVVARCAEAGIPALGASLQSPSEVAEALHAEGLDVLQLACNVLDWRFETPELAAALSVAARTRRIEVRSVFLQGLLSLPERARYPEIGRAYDACALSDFVAAAASDYAGGDPVALCLRYAASLDWASAVVVGVDTPRQLENIVESVSAGGYTPSILQEIRSRRPPVPGELLDPAKWR